MSFDQRFGAEASSVDLSEFDHGLLEGDIRVSIPVHDRFSIQLDAGGIVTSASEPPSSPGNLMDYYYVGGHATYRDPSRHALGIFGMFGSAYGGEDASSRQRGEAWLIGAEGQYYFDSVTLYGQVGYWDANQSNRRAGVKGDVMDEAWFVRGQLRVFPDTMSRIILEAAYANGQESPDPPAGGIGEICRSSNCLDLQALSWEARYDRQINQHASWFAAYHGAFVEQSGPKSAGQCCESVTEHAFLIGLRFQHGAQDLLTMDRLGVTFDTPDLGRWLGYTTEVIDTGN